MLSDGIEAGMIGRQHQLTSNFHSSAVHRKNSFPAKFTSQHDIANSLQSFSSNDDRSADAECYTSSRRKRFTRRQRRILSGGIFGKRTSRSTSTLNKVHRSESTTSSSDNDNTNERRKRSTQLTTIERKRGQSTAARNAIIPTESAFLSLRRNYVNSSLVTRSTTEICYKSSTSTSTTLASIEPVDTFQKFKGPAARKTHRRTLRYKLNSSANNQLETKAGSQARLDIHAKITQPEINTRVRRSLSVRELNGAMIDFTNQDSVTRWTSQILAEIDSLPSSSFDLTGYSAQQSAPFISAATSVATTDIISPITDTDIIFPDKSESSPLKDIWRQSTEIPEVSCTANILLTARPSNRRKQSAHAIILSMPKNPEKLSSKINSINCSSNLQNQNSENNNNETSRLWRFLSRKKKYPSFKKYLKSRQKTAPKTKIVSDVEISSFHANNSFATATNCKNHIAECNSTSKWRRNDKMEVNSALPISKTNLALALNIKSCRQQITKLSHEQLADYPSSNGVQWRRNIDATTNRTYFSMESIDLVKESGVDERLKFLGETKQIQLADQTLSPLTVWKRKVG
ncbi:unnamed protein product [Acanthocheilonema viteae]|uniref:Uncharacterized protein n=1 Tax=Acanthocheilonema viteae TaxID=6277 RepID=A0A498STE7_ACAVI|nr:unnamed protein product [Acanthocheilonema viteae]